MLTWSQVGLAAVSLGMLIMIGITFKIFVIDLGKSANAPEPDTEGQR